MIFVPSVVAEHKQPFNVMHNQSVMAWYSFSLMQDAYTCQRHSAHQMCKDAHNTNGFESEPTFRMTKWP